MAILSDKQKARQTYLVYYPYNEKTCVLELEAESFADARARLHRLADGTVMGELQDTVEIPKPLHPLLRGLLKVRRFLFENNQNAD